MDRNEQVKHIISEELAFWGAKEDGHSAMCYLMMLAGTPESVTRERLLGDHKHWRERAASFVHKDRELQDTNRNRAAQKVECIVSIGKKIAQMDQPV